MVTKTTRCDRCGKEIPHGPFPRSYAQLTHVVTFGHGKYDYMECEYDLCSKCTKALDKFIEEGANNE